MDESDLTFDEYRSKYATLNSKYMSANHSLETLQKEFAKLKEEIFDFKKEQQNDKLRIQDLISENKLLIEENLILKTKNTELNNELNKQESSKTVNKNTNELSISETVLEELKRKNFVLKLENEKAVLYINEYISKFQEFEKLLLKERKKSNQEIDQLKSELKKDKNLNEEIDKLKKENTSLVTRFTNQRLTLTRILNGQKENKEKLNTLSVQLQDKTVECEKFKQLLNKTNDSSPKFSSDESIEPGVILIYNLITSSIFNCLIKILRK